ncbi:MAG: ABC transporter [Gemmatimonadetes bacterium 13_1_40CM_4_69_8]|nr:MAG: ABC transporter [Gemmatimonadetes bacterium 13_1_40CM_69_22]OLC70472.1 MAG: ABC transporter [Gemmatimonadetes bacterium 13_1_40CM_4_69_8]
MVAKRPLRKRSTGDPHHALRDHVRELLRGGHAHLVFKDAIADWPVALRGAKPAGQPFTPWRLLEHIRISQWDIVEFTQSAKHVSPEWPAGYWPPGDAPPDAVAWDKSVAQVERDLRAMEGLVTDAKMDLFGRIPHGTGQTVLREALLLADHNSYHVGQLVLLRRLLGLYREGDG